MFEKSLDTAARALLVIASILAFLLSFVVVADVVGRVGFNSPLKGTPELVSSTIVIVCYLMASYAILTGGMLRVDAIMDRLPVFGRGLLDIFGSCLGILLFAIIITGTWEGFWHAWDSGEYEGEGALRVPMWPVRLAVLVGSTLSLLSYVVLIMRQVRALREGSVISTGVSH
jgi:TRAP-type C4-dicarboxylate transport system permease small subunit